MSGFSSTLYSLCFPTHVLILKIPKESFFSTDSLEYQVYLKGIESLEQNQIFKPQ